MGILSWIFGIGVFFRNSLFHMGIFRAYKLPGKVISVGNIAVGGTGKTPMIIAIAEHLLAKGARPAILTRGYRGGLSQNQWIALQAGKIVTGNVANSSKVRPDEALMQSTILPNVPVIVGAKRRKAAQSWSDYLLAHRKEKELPTHWLLDDGFQHRWIYRDLDVVLLDAEKPFGKLLPKGRFREPAESLGRADVVVFSRAKLPHLPRVGDRSYLALIATEAVVGCSEMIFSQPKCVWLETHELASTIAAGVFLVSGIGQPKSFRVAAEQLGLIVSGEEIFADHEPIDFVRISKRLDHDPKPVLMTEKDWARCSEDIAGFKFPVFILPMRATMPNELASSLTNKKVL